MKFSTHGKVHRIESRQVIPISIDKAWAYFSQPENLPEITPPDMKFEITSPDIIQGTYQGRIITYRLKPFPFMQSSWVTEITAVSEKKYFIDEQRLGPYAFWHHTHLLKTHPEGTEMVDQVYYKLPLGFLGKLANSLFVKGKLRKIFEYRQNKLNSIFNRS